MGIRRALGVTLIVLAGAPTGCGSDDDDDKRSGAVQDCNVFPDPCANCTCRACPCDAECNEGNFVFAECIDGCLMQQGGDFLACFEGCEAQTTGSTRENLLCTEAAVRGSCSVSCRR